MQYHAMLATECHPDDITKAFRDLMEKFDADYPNMTLVSVQHQTAVLGAKEFTRILLTILIEFK